MITLTSLPTSR
jgi:hypothetical protein